MSTAGFNVVVLEQGPYIKPETFTHDEVKYNFTPALVNDTKTQPITFRPNEHTPTVPTKAIEYGRMVGGAIAWRPHAAAL